MPPCYQQVREIYLAAKPAGAKQIPVDRQALSIPTDWMRALLALPCFNGEDWQGLRKHVRSARLRRVNIPGEWLRAMLVTLRRLSDGIH